MKEQSTTRGFAVLSITSLIVKLVSLLFFPLLNFILPQKLLVPIIHIYHIYLYICSEQPEYLLLFQSWFQTNHKITIKTP